MAGVTIEQYQTLFLDVLPTLADMIRTIAPDSQIETRYIASDGRNDEAWLGNLRDHNGNVDIWLMTLNTINGLSEEDDRKGAVGTFTKPVTVVLDYYADYRIGIDHVGDVGSEVYTNTEREFLKKILALDWSLENQKGCLHDGVLIRDWNFRLKLRRFETASCHWASGLINIEFSELFLNN